MKRAIGISVTFAIMLLLLTLLGGTPIANGQTPPPADAESLSRWQAMRFGMFIHWGPVSLKGTEIGWSRGKQVPREEYDRLFEQFNPVHFDAYEWARIAKNTGMQYVVITSKHHDGFCMWDSQYTDHDISATPFKRDVLAELSAACRKAGLAFATYYSILDWYQPDYNTMDAQGGPGYALPAGQTPNMDRYVEYVQNQLREIVTKYGPLQSMWFDGEWEEPWTVERGWALQQFCRDLDPKMLVNNRVGKGREDMKGTTKPGFAAGDYDTPEQRVGAYNTERPWETNMTICSQWAWKPDDKLKSLKECIDILVQTAGGDGNLLLNVGPMPDGRIEPRQVDRLMEIGAWMKANGESIRGTRGGPFRPEKWGCSTHKENKIFVHVLAWPDTELQLPKLDATVQFATLMDGTRISFRQDANETRCEVPRDRRDAIDTIIVLNLG